MVEVIDFYAPWCGPCKAMAPVFEKMKTKFPDVSFSKVDIDKEGSMGYDVRSIPHFVFKKGDKVISHTGILNPAMFEQKIMEIKESI